MLTIPTTKRGFDNLVRILEDMDDIAYIHVYDYITPKMRAFLEEQAEEHGFHLSITEPVTRIDIRTHADLEAEKQEQKDRWIAQQDWINSPG
jgi:hypothetical protein